MEIVKNAKVTSEYGWRTLYGQDNWHNGIDIIGDDDLLALYDGEVFFLTEDDGTGCKTIVLKHIVDNRVLLVQYSHCERFYTSTGELVKQGQIIAKMGNTGVSTGKHLHCSMYHPPSSWKWSYKTRSLYEFNPNTILKLYKESDNVYTTTIGKAKAYVVDTKGMNCEVRLSSSSSLATLSSLQYDIDKTKYKEIARVNAGLFQNDAKASDYKAHYGIEFSDLYSKVMSKDGRADCIIFKDGTVRMGDFGKEEYNVNEVLVGYSGSHCILQDGKDVLIIPSWRVTPKNYATEKFCWSFFATRDDGSYVLGAIDYNYTCNADELRTFLKGLGCTNAMVNDGGGSAELIVDGKVVNRPSERKIANGLFIYEKIGTTQDTTSAAKVEILTKLKEIQELVMKL